MSIKETSSNRYIIIKGARTNNLKNINLKIPRNKLIVITGISGSGKSSLAFDTIYAEGQRRYLESLSTYARQFLGIMNKPDVDQITGLSPTISIDQRTITHNPRSTVGTMTEIYDYLRLLFARVGKPYCPRCGRLAVRQTPEQIVTKISQLPLGVEILILAPLIKDQKGDLPKVLKRINRAGYQQISLDNQIYDLTDLATLKIEQEKTHNISVVIKRIIIDKNKDDSLVNQASLVKAITEALELGNGLVDIQRLDTKEQINFSQNFYCPKCDLILPEIEPRLFSFNNPYGACPVCTGLGTVLKIDPKLLIPNPKLTLAEGALRPWSKIFANQKYYWQILDQIAEAYGFSTKIPVGKLTAKQLDVLLYGPPKAKQGKEAPGDFVGVIPLLEKKYQETSSEYIKNELEKYMRAVPCPVCQGKRLRPAALAVKVGDRTIDEVTRLSLEKLVIFLKELTSVNRAVGLVKEKLSHQDLKISQQIIEAIKIRLRYLIDVSLGYLTLSRPAATLAGGEAQRIRLATQIGSLLTGVTYILDEPSIGLHQRDNARLIKTLKHLRDLGNTVIVVEHDEAMMRAADEIIDIGPGAGKYGGQIIVQGSLQKIKQTPSSLTGLYLSRKLKINPPAVYRRGNGKNLIIKGATANNLKNINVKIPLGKFVCLTGVSGSGKSTLMLDILARALAKKFYQAKEEPAKHREIKGEQYLDKVITIDQSPIGRTPRSNPATYTGLFTPIRELFANLPESKMKNYQEGDFSFNVKGGRCEACRGEGLVRVAMQFLSDVYIKCEVCQGRRYNKEILEIHYQGKNIADVLELTVEEASSFFHSKPQIYDKLRVLADVGLGYIQLGQPATTLSGGEAQRVKLAAELSRRATGKTLYILDEPTTGLHFEDIKHLLMVLNRLVDKGNTVLVIEHNLEVIKCADWVIDLGPEGGEGGGRIIAEGTPRDVARVRKSYTGQYLKKTLGIK